MRMICGAAAAVFMAMVLAAPGAGAAEKVTLKLKDNTVIEGPLVRVTEKAVVVSFAGIKEFEVDKADIAEMKGADGAKIDLDAAGAAKTPAAGGATPEVGDAAGTSEVTIEDTGLSEEEKAKIDRLVKDLGIAHDGNSETGPWKAAMTELRGLKSKGATLYMLGKFREATGRPKLLLAQLLAQRGEAAIIPDIDQAITEAGVNSAPPRLIDFLGMIPNDDSAKVLLKHLPNAQQPILTKIVNALGSNGNPRLAPAVTPYLEHPEPQVRAAARVGVIKYGMALAKMEEPPFDLVAILLAKLEKAKYPGDYGMIFTYIGDERVEAPILKMLESKDQTVLSQAIFAAGERRLAAAKSRLLLVSRSGDTSWKVRVGAVVALQKIGDKLVVPDLIDIAARETNREVKRQLYKTLAGLTGQGKLPSTPTAWRKWWTEEGSKL